MDSPEHRPVTAYGDKHIRPIQLLCVTGCIFRCAQPPIAITGTGIPVGNLAREITRLTQETVINNSCSHKRSYFCWAGAGFTLMFGIIGLAACARPGKV